MLCAGRREGTEPAILFFELGSLLMLIVCTIRRSACVCVVKRYLRARQQMGRLGAEVMHVIVKSEAKAEVR